MMSALTSRRLSGNSMTGRIKTTQCFVAVLCCCFFSAGGVLFFHLGGKDAEGATRTLAVLDFDGVGKVDKQIAVLLSEAVRAGIADSGDYSVLTRSFVRELLRKRSFRTGNCATKECAIEAGKILGAGAVVVGAVSRTGSTWYLSLSRISVDTGVAESVVEDKCSGEKAELLQLAGTAARKITGRAPVLLSPRSAQGDERFVVHTLTVFDSDTKLVWLRDADKAGGALTWEEANAFIDRLNKQQFAGGSDWRLPGREDFATLIAYAKSQGKKGNLNELFAKIGFENMKADYYWSSTATEEVAGVMCALDMYGGALSTASASEKGYAWAVRTGPWLFEENRQVRGGVHERSGN